MPQYRYNDIYWTVSDVAEALGVKSNTLIHRIAAGLFPEPQHSPGIARRKYYSDAEVREYLTTYAKEVK